MDGVAEKFMNAKKLAYILLLMMVALAIAQIGSVLLGATTIAMVAFVTCGICGVLGLIAGLVALFR